MKKNIILLFLFIYTSLQAQIVFQGSVLSKDSTEVPFASVTILSLTNDTIQYQLLADLKGRFTLTDLEINKYKIRITCVGYMPLDTTIVIRYPSVGGTILTKKFYLNEDSRLLDDIVITTSSTIQAIDSKSYLISKKDIHNAVSGADLLRKIPNISFDKASLTLKSLKGGNIKILINGISADLNDILSLAADQIKNIVCYDFPPARYSGYSIVLNFITKSRMSGFNAGLSISNAITTGYSKDLLHFRYNWGYNQLSLVANTDYRNYNKFDCNDNYEYKILDNSYKLHISGRRKFGYDDNYVSVAFNRYIPGKYLLNVLLSPNIQHSHIDEIQGNIFMLNQMEQKRTANLYSRTTQIIPSIDIYYNIYLKNNQELSFDFVGSLFNAQKAYKKEESFEDESIFKDTDLQKNIKFSYIYEGIYTKKIKNKAMITFGNRLCINNLIAKIHSSFDSDEYKTKMVSYYSFIETKGQYNNLQYRMSLGINHYFNKNNRTTSSSLVFLPQIIIGIKLNDDFTMRTVFNRTTSIPTLSELSNNKILVTENIITQGNPYLKNTTSNTMGIMLGYNKSWLISELLVGYSKEYNSFNKYFIVDNEYFYLKNENANYEKVFLVQDAFTIMPLHNSNLLMAKITASYMHCNINSELIGVYSHDQIPISYEIILNFKKFDISYSGNVLSWELNAPYLEKGERISSLSMSYLPKENVCISAAILWLGKDASYFKKTLSNSIVNNWGGTNIHNNRNMITLGFSYRFKSGKSYESKNKNIQNKDTDSGIN